MFRTDLNDDQTYLINQDLGKQFKTDKGGNIVKSLNPKITGRYNYYRRQERVTALKADVSPVDYPKSLNYSPKAVYLPQT